jgi:stearoyl-CoA desaturase (delta-9 desaturase)
VGWHRYFVHKSFKTNKFIEWLLFLGGASIFIGSLSEWIQDHQNHHKHLNSEKDPTNINQGIFYSHIGWALIERPQTILEKNKLLQYWHKNYIFFALLSGLIFPVGMSYLISENFLLSLCVSFGLRILFSQNIIGLLGSYCHQQKKEMSIDSHFVSLLCFGEGYQKYHHEFPGDYRNGPRKMDLDISKWIIYILSKFGIVSELRKKAQ